MRPCECGQTGNRQSERERERLISRQDDTHAKMDEIKLRGIEVQIVVWSEDGAISGWSHTRKAMDEHRLSGRDTVVDELKQSTEGRQHTLGVIVTLARRDDQLCSEGCNRKPVVRHPFPLAFVEISGAHCLAVHHSRNIVRLQNRERACGFDVAHIHRAGCDGIAVDLENGWNGAVAGVRQSQKWGAKGVAPTTAEKCSIVELKRETCTATQLTQMREDHCPRREVECEMEDVSV